MNQYSVLNGIYHLRETIGSGIISKLKQILILDIISVLFNVYFYGIQTCNFMYSHIHTCIYVKMCAYININ